MGVGWDMKVSIKVIFAYVNYREVIGFSELQSFIKKKEKVAFFQCYIKALITSPTYKKHSIVTLFIGLYTVVFTWKVPRTIITPESR